MYEQLVTALLTDPEAYGGLRSCKGWFVPKTEIQEREETTTDRLESVKAKESEF